MDAWFQYIQQRYALFYYGALSAGLVLSGIHLFFQAPNFTAFSFSFFALLLYFAQARFIDDYQDIDKDAIAHPDRALSLTRSDLNRLIIFFQGTLIFYTILIAIFTNYMAAGLYLVAIGYLWIIHKQFFFLKNYFQDPAWHLWAYPLAFIPLVLFTIAIGNPDVLENWKTVGLVLAVVGAFITNDFCRKLNPHAHPILMTYMQFYGYKKTFIMAVISLIISAIGAALMHAGSFLWPCEIVVLITLLFPFYQSERAHLPRVAGVFSLFMHAWSGFINWLLSF